MAITLVGTNNDTRATDGSLGVGRDGSGTLTVDAGGGDSILTLADPDESDDPGLTVGRGTNGVGSALITGVGAKIRIIGSDPLTSDGGPGLNVGRDGASGTLTLNAGAALEVTSTAAASAVGATIGRGTGSQGQMTVSGGSSVLLDGPSTSFRIGRDGGEGTLTIEQSSVVNIIADPTFTENPDPTGFDDGYANLQVGFGSLTAGASGRLTVDNSTVNVSGASAGLMVGSGPLPASGEIELTNGAAINITGANAFANFGTTSGGQANALIASGSRIRVEDTNHALNGSAFIGIGNAAGVVSAKVDVKGANSLLEAVDGSILVGIWPFGTVVTGNGELWVRDGASLAASNISIGRGGSLWGHGASITGTVHLQAGTFQLTGPMTIDGNLYGGAGGTLRFGMDTDGTSDGFASVTGDIYLNDITLAVDTNNGFTFSAGQTVTLATTTGAGKGIGFGGNLDPTKVFVTGQAAGFGYAIGSTGTDLVIEALTSGATPGLAVLDFGSSSFNAATFAYNSSTKAGRGFGGDTFGGSVVAREVDQILGTAANDTFTITGSLAMTLKGFGGNDTLRSGSASDQLHGGAGSDTYYVSAGDIVYETGVGTDTVFASTSYALSAAATIEVLRTINAAASTAINLTGSSVANTIMGNAGANRLDGKGGADKLYGYGGNDTYYVDNARDLVVDSAGTTDTVIASTSYALSASASVEVLRTINAAATTTMNLTGSSVANTVMGNAGANVLAGKAGKDVLSGFAGKDTFVFDTALNASTNVDSIRDFSAPYDTMKLENAYFKGLAAGTLTAGAFKLGKVATEADDRVLYDKATGYLYFDQDGSGAAYKAVLFASLYNKTAISNVDFIVV